MSIVQHKANEHYPWELKKKVLQNLADRGVLITVNMALGQFFWIKDGYHDSETGDLVDKPS